MIQVTRLRYFDINTPVYIQYYESKYILNDAVFQENQHITYLSRVLRL